MRDLRWYSFMDPYRFYLHLCFAFLYSTLILLINTSLCFNWSIFSSQIILWWFTILKSRTFFTHFGPIILLLLFFLVLCCESCNIVHSLTFSNQASLWYLRLWNSYFLVCMSAVEIWNGNHYRTVNVIIFLTYFLNDSVFLSSSSYSHNSSNLIWQ